MSRSPVSASIRDMKRAPIRIATSIMAVALAIAAIGVFAVPGVAESSVRAIAAQDKLSHLEIEITPIDENALAGFSAATSLDQLEAHVVGTRPTSTGNVRVLGRTASDELDRIRLLEGRLAVGDDEVVATPGLGSVGETLQLSAFTGEPVTLAIVGVGETTWFGEGATLFTSAATAQALLGIDGVNRIVGRHDNPTYDNLEASVAALRSDITNAGATVTSFPDVLADGAHPIEEDITMISFMIGSLGVVAGIVALILLGSTANGIVTERTRDAAIMRAVGGSRRAVRKDLRRLAMMIGAVGTVVGLPLGVLVANVIARMVLTRFADITPDIGVDVRVMAASALFGIIGARLVSGRVARRVANADLAAALRDRDGLPFGRRRSDRMFAMIPTGCAEHRMALRSVARRRGRAVAVAAQFAGAVAAAVLVASLVTSILDFNRAEVEALRWETRTVAADPIYPFAFDAPTTVDVEVGIHTWAELDGWELEVYGVDPSTSMFDTAVDSGIWLGDAPDARSVVLAERFATQEGYAIGDTVSVDLANGSVPYEVVGLHPVRSVAIFIAKDTLSADLQTDGRGDTVWTRGGASVPEFEGIASRTSSPAELYADEAAARDAILAIFAAIGAIVVTIAGLGASSTVAMNLYERRAELATIQASGAQRRDVRRLVRAELLGLALIGWGVGSVAGWQGAKAIIGFFAVENAIDLGFTLAWAALPISAAVAVGFVYVLAMTAARGAGRQPIAVTLRAAT